jgi:hypothetical protein
MQAFPRIALALSVFALLVGHAAAQKLQCNPCSHGFGRVQVGASKQYVIQLTNTGTRALHILAVKRKGTAFSTGKLLLPLKLRPGAATTLPVVFTPTVTGKVTGTINVLSDALNPKLSINVWGTGVNASAGSLTTNPSSLDFGNVTVGSGSSLAVTLSATGGAVTVTSAQTDNAEFAVSGLALPATIAAGQSISLSVTFTPAAGGSAVGKLTLVSDATNSPTNIALAGTGVVAGSHSTDLSWDASKDPVIGYNIYRGTKRYGTYSQINSALDSSTGYSDTSVVAGTTYFYAVTAVDANNRESVYSNVVKVVIPSP